MLFSDTCFCYRLLLLPAGQSVRGQGHEPIAALHVSYQQGLAQKLMLLDVGGSEPQKSRSGKGILPGRRRRGSADFPTR